MSYDPRFRRTKVVATLGPASSDETTIREMIRGGVNVFRINSAHGTPAGRAGLIATVRRLRDELRRHVAVLVDLQGPRIRVGSMSNPRPLEEGAEVVFAPESSAAPGAIPTTYDALAQDVQVGSAILLDDGLMVVEVTATSGDRVRGIVRHGGLLKSNKGINLPGVHVSAPAVTEKDRADIELAVENEADFVGVSFVRCAEDVEEVRSISGGGVGVIAKIERADALRDIERIVGAADGLMVARGDLGVELPFEEVPLTQKHLIAVATQHGKPVITATQMLESMVHNPRPTRAEVSDVANAILDGTDAVMLSAETAIGEHPVAAVQAVARIIGELEMAILKDQIPWGRKLEGAPVGRSRAVSDAIASAAIAAAEMLVVPLILCVTRSGFTARILAARRPATPILGLSTEWRTCRSLSLVWGVLPMQADAIPDYEAMLDVARGALLQNEYARVGDRIVVTAGLPFEVPGTTNLIKIETV